MTMCAACGRRKANRGTRGLCRPCWDDPEIRMDAPTKFWRADDLLDTWDELRREGYDVRQAAERIGVTFGALDKALCRAKRRGDPRAKRPHSECAPKRYRVGGIA